jgi:CelD/BcsL family acetyltransferase involved in cellulose biosynthesis
MVIASVERIDQAAPTVYHSDLLAVNDPRWLCFAADVPSATIFHHPAWSSLLAACYGYRPLALALSGGGGRTDALLPIMEVAGLLRNKRWIALPFTDYCPPLLAGAVTAKELATALLTVQAQQGVARGEVRAAVDHPAFPARLAAVRHTLDVSASFGRVEARFSKMHQRNVRKATRAGVSAHFDDSVEGMRHYYRLHVLTRRRQGVPSQSWRFFRLLWERLIRPGLGRVLLASSGGASLAGAVFLGWNGTLIYKYGASDLTFADSRPNNLLFHTAIQWACATGYDTLDWGRTDLANRGLREFKSGWGAREERLIYTLFGAGPAASEHGRMRPVADRLLTAVIHGSPPLVGRAIGTVLYRYAT